MEHYPFVIIGAGPAGLTAAYELVKQGIQPMVLEKGDKVGGLARTENYNGFYFDLGGHRFFTKTEEVKKMWHEVLGDDFLRRPRLSRIYYRKRFFYYPLRAFNALRGLGFVEGVLILLSYIRWQIFPYRREDTFEQWVTNRFGRRLYRTFFKTYTEKVWGIPCSELKAEWAAQRIKDLSLKTALLSMFVRPQKTIKTLIEEFHYPRLGPGMMWNAVKGLIERQGGVISLNHEVVRIHRNGTRIESVVVSCNGEEKTITGMHFISSMPVAEFIQKLDPPPPPAILEAADKLNYRDFVTVCLIVRKPDLFPDNWIYVHDPEVKVSRIQNFKNWSPQMVPDPAKTSLGLEYFCAEGDNFWNLSDADLVELGKRELDRIGLARCGDIEDGCVIRVAKSYPIYDSDYCEHLARIKEFVSTLENFQTIGRSGLHRYNNQDHAMLTGMLAVRSATQGEKNDLWSVNTDREYLEEIREEVGIPTPEVTAALQDALVRVFPKLDRIALGLSTGLALGLALFLATLWLVVRGKAMAGPTLGLLSQYYPGYTVTALGSIVGLAYGFITGFVGGWGFAFLRNAAVFLSMAIIHRRAETYHLRRLLEYL